MTPQLLTNSRSTSFKVCRRRHWYEYEIGLRPIVDAKALRMGTAFHVGLEQLKASADIEDAVEKVGRFYESLV